MENLKFCYEKKPFEVAKGVVAKQSAVAFKSKYWDKGHTLKIYFINGSVSQKANMENVINEMTDPLSIEYQIVSTVEESELRISFNYGYGSYSYLGTDALFISKTEETLNIGWEGFDVMRHEFGHALNLLHEHQNPKEGIVWNESEVIKSLSGPPNSWTLEQIRHNVLDKVDINALDSTDFDSKSIMLYYFPNSWTIGNFETNHNSVVSEIDKSFLLSKYGITEQDKIAPVITLNGDNNIILFIGDEYIESGATANDINDGNITDKIIITGEVNTNEVGTYHILYSVEDKAGNKSEKIRNILIEEKPIEGELPDGCLFAFLPKLFTSKKKLNKLLESQLIFIANELGINAVKKDLKKDTADKIWLIINENKN